jgi:hypothetical protein
MLVDMSVSATGIATGGQVAHRPWLRVERRERALRFMLEIGLLGGALLRLGEARLRARVLRPRGRDRLVARGGRYRLPLPARARVLAGRAARDLLANDYIKLPVGTALAQTVGNVLEVVLAAYLLRRAARSGYLLGRVDGLVRLLPPLALATMVSATVGTLASRVGGVVSSDAFWTVWRTWWLGDACGALVVVPFALAWSRPRSRLSRARAAEFVLMLATTGALTAVAFSSPKALEYLAFPGLIWAGLRFGQRGATLALALVTEWRSGV